MQLHVHLASHGLILRLWRCVGVLGWVVVRNITMHFIRILNDKTRLQIDLFGHLVQEVEHLVESVQATITIRKGLGAYRLYKPSPASEFVPTQMTTPRCTH